MRVIDLDHLRRDIRQIPDGQGKFDNAFWGFTGLGAPLVLQDIPAIIHGGHAGLDLYVGILCVCVAVVFALFGRKAKKDRDAAIGRIVQNIEDFSNGALDSDPEPAGFPERLQDAILTRISGKTH